MHTDDDDHDSKPVPGTATAGAVAGWLSRKATQTAARMEEGAQPPAADPQP